MRRCVLKASPLAERGCKARATDFIEEFETAWTATAIKMLNLTDKRVAACCQT
jgi:hypothetical protein